jgi:hypothetical protein
MKTAPKEAVRHQAEPTPSTSPLHTPWRPGKIILAPAISPLRLRLPQGDSIFSSNLATANDQHRQVLRGQRFVLGVVGPPAAIVGVRHERLLQMQQDTILPPQTGALVELKPRSPSSKRDMPRWRVPLRCRLDRKAAPALRASRPAIDSGPGRRTCEMLLAAIQTDAALDRSASTTAMRERRSANARRPVAHQRFEVAEGAAQLIDRELFDRAQPVLRELALEAREMSVDPAVALVLVQHAAHLVGHGAGDVGRRLERPDGRLGAGVLVPARRRPLPPRSRAALSRCHPEQEGSRNDQGHRENGAAQTSQRSQHAARVDSPRHRRIGGFRWDLEPRYACLRRACPGRRVLTPTLASKAVLR